MPSLREDLLRPSLSQPADLVATPYSTRAAFLISFIGGPIAALAIFAVNAWRLGRLRRDAGAWLLGACVYAGWIAALVSSAPDAPWKAQLTELLGASPWGLILRLIALTVFGLASFCHRREQRSATLFGLVRPNPWIVGIGLVVAGRLPSLVAALPT